MMRSNVINIAMTAAASFLGLTTDLRAQEAATVPEVEITGTAPGVLRQELPVGPYGQPEWTTERAFSNSRVYVRPAGTLEFDQFWTPEFAEGDAPRAKKGFVRRRQCLPANHRETLSG
jgi:hypothetical protein